MRRSIRCINPDYAQSLTVDKHFLPAFVILLLVLNPLACGYALGTVRSGAGTVANMRHRLPIMKACSCSLFALLAASLLGQTALHWFSLSAASVQISSGLILFLLAISMIFSRPGAAAGNRRGLPSLGTYAAGCVAVASVLLLSAAQAGHWPEIATALACAVIVCAVLMRICYRLQHHFGFAMAVGGLQKLTGLILTAIAVDRILLGSQQYFSA